MNPVSLLFIRRRFTQKKRSGCTNVWNIWLMILFLSGCATRQPVSEDIRNAFWQRHSEQLIELHSWQLKGRIAIQRGKEGGSVSLHWQQDRHNYFLRVVAPLGRGTYELSGSEDGVVMRTEKNKLLHADNPETLLQENLGWQVPLSALRYWVRGLPEPDIKTDSLILDEKGRITKLSQSGWQISYIPYVKNSGYELPGKIFMQNDRLKLRLVIRDWKI